MINKTDQTWLVFSLETFDSIFPLLVFELQFVEQVGDDIPHWVTEKGFAEDLDLLDVLDEFNGIQRFVENFLKDLVVLWYLPELSPLLSTPAATADSCSDQSSSWSNAFVYQDVPAKNFVYLLKS